MKPKLTANAVILRGLDSQSKQLCMNLPDSTPASIILDTLSMLRFITCNGIYVQRQCTNKDNRDLFFLQHCACLWSLLQYLMLGAVIYSILVDLAGGGNPYESHSRPEGTSPSSRSYFHHSLHVQNRIKHINRELTDILNFGSGCIYFSSLGLKVRIAALNWKRKTRKYFPLSHRYAVLFPQVKLFRLSAGNFLHNSTDLLNYVCLIHWENCSEEQLFRTLFLPLLLHLTSVQSKHQRIARNTNM